MAAKYSRPGATSRPAGCCSSDACKRRRPGPRRWFGRLRPEFRKPCRPSWRLQARAPRRPTDGAKQRVESRMRHGDSFELSQRDREANVRIADRLIPGWPDRSVVTTPPDRKPRGQRPALSRPAVTRNSERISSSSAGCSTHYSAGAQVCRHANNTAVPTTRPSVSTPARGHASPTLRLSFGGGRGEEHASHRKRRRKLREVHKPIRVRYRKSTRVVDRHFLPPICFVETKPFPAERNAPQDASSSIASKQTHEATAAGRTSRWAGAQTQELWALRAKRSSKWPPEHSSLPQCNVQF
jgi:hypothetical protein